MSAPTSGMWTVAAVSLLLLALSYRPARKVRYEIEIEGTTDEKPDAGSRWVAYRFKGKPVDPLRRPRQFAPYHLRLDWMMWFAALSPERQWWVRKELEELSPPMTS